MKRDKLVRSPVYNEIVGDSGESLKFGKNAFTVNALEDKILSCKEIDDNEEEVGSSCPRGTEVVFPYFQRESQSTRKRGICCVGGSYDAFSSFCFLLIPHLEIAVVC